MEDVALRKWILQSLKLHGFSVRADAAAYLASQMSPMELSLRAKWMERIADHIQKLNLDTMIVDRKHMEECLEECTRKQPSTETVWNVINIFEVPCYSFDTERNKFIKDGAKRDLLGTPVMKSWVFRRRYATLLQRTLRHSLFREQVALGAEKAKFTLKKVEWFLCSSSKIDDAVILGLLVRKSELDYCIEDSTGSLHLDLSKAKFHDGLFPEHCLVLVEGSYEDKVFHVVGLGFPPAETAKKSRPYFGNLNTFGGPSDVNLSHSVALQQIQKNNPDAMIVFLSDVWLDNIKVLEKLRVLFTGYADSPPLAFVLLGNFLSRPMGASHTRQLRACLKTLADMITSVPELSACHFVLVPGSTDPGSPLALPRSPLPNFVTEEFTARVKNAVMATNPCRIQYCTREVVVMREDLVTKMCRNSISFPSSGDLHTHGTLVPMSLNVCPVYWSSSHSLDLYPLPDLVVIGDQFNAFSTTYMDCTVVNPGSFLKSGFSFRVYLPATNAIEESAIPEAE